MPDIGDILSHYNIILPSQAPGRYKITCPWCSASRKPNHRKIKVLYVNITVDGRVYWGCNHCKRTGPEKGLHDELPHYDYGDNRKVRTGPHRFAWQHRAANGGWASGTENLDKAALYRLEDAIECGGTILVCEGEKDVDNLWSIGFAAVCNAHGAGSWTAAHSELLRGKSIIVLNDNDEPGYAHAGHVVRCSLNVAASVRRLDLKNYWLDIGEGEDISDWLEKGGGTEDWLERIIDELPEINGHAGTQPVTPPRLIQTLGQFLADFVPPDYVIDGLLQRQFLYALTGKTGSGKTAIMLLLSVAIALGRKIGDIEITQGRVLYFAGENPDDIRMRLIAMAQNMFFEPGDVPLHIIPGRFSISQLRERIIREANDIGDFALVVIDTSAAYYEGTEVNSNTEQVKHAAMFRSLISLPGRPCVVANCHPVKRASADDLLPLGAGGFLNEIDGNLTCSNDYPAVTLHWQGKFRGPDFKPLHFKLDTVTHEQLKDRKGTLIPTVIASHLSETGIEEIEKASSAEQDRLVAEIEQDGTMSVKEYAMRCGFLLANGEPHKSKTHRLIRSLISQKRIKGRAGNYAVPELERSRSRSSTKENSERLERNE